MGLQYRGAAAQRRSRSPSLRDAHRDLDLHLELFKWKTHCKSSFYNAKRISLQLPGRQLGGFCWPGAELEVSLSFVRGAHFKVKSVGVPTLWIPSR